MLGLPPWGEAAPGEPVAGAPIQVCSELLICVRVKFSQARNREGCKRLYPIVLSRSNDDIHEAMPSFVQLAPSRLIGSIDRFCPFPQPALCDANETHEGRLRIIVGEVINFFLGDEVKNNHGAPIQTTAGDSTNGGISPRVSTAPATSRR
jgi:hypothetical protein